MFVIHLLLESIPKEYFRKAYLHRKAQKFPEIIPGTNPEDSENSGTYGCIWISKRTIAWGSMFPRYLIYPWKRGEVFSLYASHFKEIWSGITA